jgi:hypothetical protein
MHHSPPAAATAAAPAGLSLPAYPAMLRAYDRRTRAAYEVMGTRWRRFLDAKQELLALEPGSREWHFAAERAYRLGLRSTHAYYLWTCGHTALVLRLLGARRGGDELRLALREELQSLDSSR